MKLSDVRVSGRRWTGIGVFCLVALIAATNLIQTVFFSGGDSVTTEVGESKKVARSVPGKLEPATDPDEPGETRRLGGTFANPNSAPTVNATPIDPAAVGVWQPQVEIRRTGFKYPLLRWKGEVLIGDDLDSDKRRTLSVAVADHVLVGLRGDVESDEAIAALEAAGFTVGKKLNGGSMLLVEVPDPEEIDALERIIESLGDLGELVAFAEPDYLVWPSILPTDPAFASGRMWGLHNTGIGTRVEDADIDAPEAWDIRSTAPGVVIAITDGGGRLTHEDLAPNLWTNALETAGDGLDNDFNNITDDIHGFDAYDDDGDPNDEDGHGTHVAGTAGARGNNGLGMAGVAHEVELMHIKFIGPDGGATSDAIRAIDYARLKGAHIINASWGGADFSQGLFESIERCRNEDIILVAAAGNESSNNDAVPNYPSDYALPNIVSVASSDTRDRLSDFSNFGRQTVDLAAPGSDIWSCSYLSDTGYNYLNGTSMAAPHVSGALALAMAEFPDDSADQLIARLLSSTDPVADLEGKVFTGGRLNLERLLGNSDSMLANDDFSGALGLQGSFGTWSGNLTEATREPGEDDFSIPGTGFHSVWFAWQAPHSGLVGMIAESNLDDLRMVVFEGSDRDGLTVVRDGGNPSTRESAFFYAEAGTDYRILIDTADPGGFVTLELLLRPMNDNLSEAAELSGDRFNVGGSNVGATAEPFERAAPHAGVGVGQSVWWGWQSPVDGPFTITTAGSEFDTVLAVYQGQPGALVEVASDDDRSAFDWGSSVSFEAVAGTIYWIAVDSFRPAHRGDIVLNGYESGELVVLSDIQSSVIRAGSTAFFTFLVSGGDEVVYEWYQDGERIPFESGHELVIERTRQEDAGVYHAIARRDDTEVRSSDATLGFFDSAPEIVWLSGDQAVAQGESATLRVSADGPGDLMYQWFHEDVAIPGAVEEFLTISNVQQADTGYYHVIVSNAIGEQVSSKILLEAQRRPWGAWTRVRPKVFSELISIDFHNGRFIALSHGWVSESEDSGENWRHYPLPSAKISARAINFGNGVYVLLTGSQETPVLVSTDLRTWTEGTIEEDFAVPREITFGNGVFVARSGHGLHTSTDGITWNLVVSAAIADMAFGNGIFVAKSFDDMTYFSPDGESWNAHPGAPTGEVVLEYLNGKFHIWQSAFDGRHFETTNLSDWGTGQPGRVYKYHEDNVRVRYIDGQFVAPDTSARILFSPTGSNWQRRELGTGHGQISVTQGNGWVIVSGSVFGRSQSLAGLAFQPGDDLFYNGVITEIRDEMVLTNGVTQAWYSAHGDVWDKAPSFTAQSPGGYNPKMLNYAFGKYWAADPGLQSGNSPDNIRRILPPPAPFDGTVLGLRSGNGRMVAIASGVRRIFYTDDGVEWTPTTASASIRAPQLLFVRGHFLVLDGDQFLISPDGVTWTTQDPANLAESPTFYNFYEAACDAFGKICVFSSGGSLVTSIDGLTWTSQDIPISFEPGHDSTAMSAAGNATSIVTISGPGTLAFTEDMQTWIEEPAPSIAMNQITFSNGNYVVSGGTGTAVCHGTIGQLMPRLDLATEFEGQIFVKNGLPLDLDATLVDPQGLFSHFNIYLDGELFLSGFKDLSFDLSALPAGRHLIEIETVSTDGSVTRDRGELDLREEGFVSLTQSPPTVRTVSEIGGELMVGDATGRIWNLTSDSTWNVRPLPVKERINALFEAGGAVYASTESSTFRTEDLNSFTRVGNAIEELFEAPFGLFALFDTRRIYYGVGFSSLDNGLSWQQQAWKENLAYGNGVIVSRCRGIGRDIFCLSTDGSAFRQPLELPPGPASFAGDKFYAASTSEVASSTDGDHWDTEFTYGPIMSGGQELRGTVSFHSLGGKVLATQPIGINDDDKLILVSSGGGDWAEVVPPLEIQGEIEFGDGAWWILNRDGVHRSPDAINWTLALTRAALGEFHEGFLHGETDRVLIVTRGGKIGVIDSVSGLVVEEEMIGANLVSIGGYGVFPGPGGFVVANSDSIGFTTDFESIETIDALAFVHDRPLIGSDGGRFAAIQRDGTFHESSDGRTWTAGEPLTIGTHDRQREVVVDGDLTLVTWSDAQLNQNILFAKQAASPWVKVDLAAVGLGNGDGPMKLRSLDGVYWILTRDLVLLKSTNGTDWQIHLASSNYIPTAKLGDTYLGEPAHENESLWFGTSQDLLTWERDEGLDVFRGTVHNVVREGDTIYISSGGSIYATEDLSGDWRQYELSQIGVSLSVGSGQVFAWALDEAAFNAGTIWALCRDSDYLTDLAVFTDADTFGAGDEIELDLERTNRGAEISAGAEGLEIVLYLSRNLRFGDSDDILAGSVAVDFSDLAVGASETHRVSLVVPDEILPDRYTLFARTEKPCASGFGVRQLQTRSLPGVIEIPEWELALVIAGDGIVASSRDGRRFAHGSNVSLSATAGKGATFAGWGGDALGSFDQITVLMDSDKLVHANFDPAHTLQVFTVGNGQVEGLSPEGSYAPGEFAQLTAVPAPGWVFAGWDGDANGAETDLAIEMDASMAVTARFTLTWEAWQSRHFTAAELGDPEISGAVANPDGDLLTNWQEYRHAGDPSTPGIPWEVAGDPGGEFLNVIFTRLQFADPAQMVKPQASSDLLNWSEDTIEVRILNTHNGVETVEARIPVSGSERLYLRLNDGAVNQ